MMMTEASPASAALFGWGPDTRLGRILRFKLQVKKEPDHLADTLDTLMYDEVHPISKMIYTRNIYGQKLGWYELGSGYVDATWVQPVFNRPNPIDRRPIPDEGCLGEVTVPLAPVYSKPNVRDIHRTFYYENNFWIKGKTRDERGFPWYELWDDLSGVSYFVHANTMRRIEPMKSHRCEQRFPRIRNDWYWSLVTRLCVPMSTTSLFGKRQFLPEKLMVPRLSGAG